MRKPSLQHFFWHSGGVFWPSFLHRFLHFFMDFGGFFSHLDPDLTSEIPVHTQHPRIVDSTLPVCCQNTRDNSRDNSEQSCET